MSVSLSFSVHTVFGNAFDVEKDPSRKSGFRPAKVDMGANKELFGDLRLDGFAALLRLGFAEHLVVVGGNEARYKGEVPVINRAQAICKMLAEDMEIDVSKLRAIASGPNTGGNIAIIKKVVTELSVSQTYGGSSNHYHLPRVYEDMRVAGLTCRLWPAESFWLLEDESRKQDLILRLGGGSLAERIAEEIQGIAHKLRGTYEAKSK